MLKDRIVVVTGASSGVGRAISRALGAAGAKVALLARGQDGLDAAAREIRAAGGQALTLATDMGDAEAVHAAADRVVFEWGRIDVWINNAMVSVFAPVRDTTPEEYRRVTQITYLGYVHGTLAALARMRSRNSGHIIQVGSALAYRSIPLQSAYCAAKSAVRGFTDSLRCELAHDRSAVHVTMLQLPAMNTPQFGVVRNKLGLHARPVPPTYQPELAAQAALYAIEHPRREIWIGRSTAEAIVGQRLIPAMLDRYLGRMAWRSQLTTALPPTTADNLDFPLPGDRGAHGPFDAEARSHSAELWIGTHRGLTMLGAAAGGWLGVAAVRRLAKALG